MEMTPTVMNCENRCVYCWRPTEFYDTLEMPAELVDEPDIIVENLMAERKKLINGFYGNAKNDKKRLDESLLPEHYAISLSGEPTMYPKLPQLINYLESLENDKINIPCYKRSRASDASDDWLMKMRSLPNCIYLLMHPIGRRFTVLIDHATKMPGKGGGKVCVFLRLQTQEPS